MNSLLSFSHVLNNHSQSLSLLNKHAADVNSKLTFLEQKIKSLENKQPELNEDKIKNMIKTMTSQEINEDKIKVIIKEHLNSALKHINLTQQSEKIVGNNSSVLEELELDNKSSDNSGYDDIVIQEKTAKKTVGRKPKK